MNTSTVSRRQFLGTAAASSMAMASPQTTTGNERIDQARQVALDILKPSRRDLDYGLKLHAESIVFDCYGFSPRAAVDGDAIRRAMDEGASDKEVRDMRENMTMTRPPVRLRDLHPPHRARRPSPGHEFRPHLRAVAPPMNFEFVDGHPIDPSRAPVAFDRRPRPRQILLGDPLVHQVFVHRFLSRVSRHSPWLPPASARSGSTASASACSPFRSPSQGKDLAARDSGKPVGRLCQSLL